MLLAVFPQQGGKKGPIVGGWCGADSYYGCPCKFDPKDFSGWDCRILNGLEFLHPGETKEFGIAFMAPEIVPAFRMVQKFYLWEGRIFGEASSHL